jgi:hypothetical protein
MKPHIIELERLDGAYNEGPLHIEVQGAMSVKLEPRPMEGVYESKLRMSRKTAISLLTALHEVLKPPPAA